MHEKLTDRGYTVEQIEKMTPAGALASMIMGKDDGVVFEASGAPMFSAKRGGEEGIVTKPMYPSDPTMERAVLGNLLLDVSGYPEVARLLDADDFYIVKHGWYWSAITALIGKDEPVSPVTVTAELRAAGRMRDGDLDADVHKLQLDAAANNSEALHLAQEVKALAGRRAMIRAGARTTELAHDSSVDPSDILRLAQSDLDVIQIGDPDAPILSLMTANTILQTDWPEPIWAIPGLMPVGLTILAGKAKLGKSWLALQIAQAVAAGGYALDQHVEQGPVLYLALEDNPARLKNRMRKQGWPLDLTADFMVMGEFARQVGDLKKGGGERLAAQIERAGYRLVVIDTLSRSCHGDQNDVEQMTRALTPLQEMAHAQNCAILMNDHHRKGFGTNPDAVADILGSTAKGAMADSIWGLYRERGKSGAKLAVTGRDLEEQNLAIKMDWLTGCWQVTGNADAIALTERRQEIIDTLKLLEEPAGVTDIAKAIGQNKGKTYQRLQTLCAGGLVVRKGVGKRVFYSLREEEDIG